MLELTTLTHGIGGRPNAMVVRREREPLSPRASAGGAGAEGASSHDDDVRFWRERALRLAESGQAGPSGDAFGEGRRPGAAAAALDALLRPRASADGTRVGRSTSTSGGRASARRALDTNPTSVGPAGDGTKTRRAETHAAVASLHAVAADLTERAEAVDAELAALAERKADAHEKRARALDDRARRAAAPLERRRDHIARLVEDVERSLRRAADEGFDDGSTALRVREEAARARDACDAIARDAEKQDTSPSFAEDEEEAETAKTAKFTKKESGAPRGLGNDDDVVRSRRNHHAKEAGAKEAGGLRRGRPREVAFSGFAFSPPASPPRRRAVSSEARASANPPWDKRVALDTSRDDGARARRDRSRSKSPARDASAIRDAFASETRSRPNASAVTESAEARARSADARRKVLAGDVPWYAGAIPPRATVYAGAPSPGGRAERERERERDPRDSRDPNGNGNGDRVPSAPDFAAAFWPDFAAYGYGGGASPGMRPGDASSRVEALRGGYQTALLEMQRARAAEREAAAAAAEAAARELELQRAQLVAIASRLAKAAGVPSAPRAWGGSISRAADAAAFAAEAERSEAAPGPAFEAAAAAAERERRNRATRRARAYDEKVEEGAETAAGRIRRGTSSGSLASAMADLAEVARVTRERMEGTGAEETSAHEAVATAAREAAAAAAASAAGGSPAVVAAALAEMTAALRRAERAAAGVDASAARDEARAARAESMLAQTADALEGETRGSDAEFGLILDGLRVARDRVESDDDERDGPQPRFDEETFILNGILEKADAEARSDAEAAAAAAAIRGSFEARGEKPRVSAASPRRPARRRQLGDRVPPDPRRPSSLEFKGPARFGARGEAKTDSLKKKQTLERETYEVVGPASFSVNEFGSLVFAAEAAGLQRDHTVASSV